jgi:hypothetical protein
MTPGLHCGTRPGTVGGHLHGMQKFDQKRLAKEPDSRSGAFFVFVAEYVAITVAPLGSRAR